MNSLIQDIKAPFLNGGINDLAIYMGDLCVMLTFISFVKLDKLGFGFWFEWSLFWMPS